jgi:hypothetical protein
MITIFDDFNLDGVHNVIFFQNFPSFALYECISNRILAYSMSREAKVASN